jgi:hypothetical protein
MVKTAATAPLFWRNPLVAALVESDTLAVGAASELVTVWNCVWVTTCPSEPVDKLRLAIVLVVGVLLGKALVVLGGADEVLGGWEELEGNGEELETGALEPVSELEDEPVSEEEEEAGGGGGGGAADDTAGADAESVGGREDAELGREVMFEY